MQHLLLFRVPQQGQHAVANQGQGCLVTGHEQKNAHAEHLLLAQPVALFLYDQEGADQIVLGTPPPLGENGAQVLFQRMHALLGVGDSAAAGSQPVRSAR